jgi:hypothetical protein
VKVQGWVGGWVVVVGKIRDLEQPSGGECLIIGSCSGEGARVWDSTPMKKNATAQNSVGHDLAQLSQFACFFNQEALRLGQTSLSLYSVLHKGMQAPNRA